MQTTKPSARTYPQISRMSIFVGPFSPTSTCTSTSARHASRSWSASSTLRASDVERIASCQMRSRSVAYGGFSVCIQKYRAPRPFRWMTMAEMNSTAPLRCSESVPMVMRYSARRSSRRNAQSSSRTPSNERTPTVGFRKVIAAANVPSGAFVRNRPDARSRRCGCGGDASGHRLQFVKPGEVLDTLVHVPVEERNTFLPAQERGDDRVCFMRGFRSRSDRRPERPYDEASERLTERGSEEVDARDAPVEK